uniref:Uncharacterized protein n=1 Tax=Cacopsylla melanoneura TaxID=428564 RepID=A0A8D8TCZ0_9HEMI
MLEGNRKEGRDWERSIKGGKREEIGREVSREGKKEEIGKEVSREGKEEIGRSIKGEKKGRKGIEALEGVIIGKRLISYTYKILSNKQLSKTQYIIILVRPNGARIYVKMEDIRRERRTLRERKRKVPTIHYNRRGREKSTLK